jgi:DNA-binding Lrp family transcriptional regulator
METPSDALRLDESDRNLLNALQWDFPLVERPFAAIGDRLGMTEQDVLDRVSRLRAGGVIRQMSAIFDSGSLGYKSSLVAMRVEPENEGHAVAAVNAHPGVSHNYRRDHAFNMWFTLTVHGSKNLGTEMRLLAEAADADAALLLPTLRTFKIGVKLDVTGRAHASEREEETPDAPGRELPPLTVDDVLTVRELQKDLPTRPAAFAEAADRLGITTPGLLTRARTMLECGRMRRFAAVLRHRNAGFTHNAMSVWRCPPEDIERCGRIIASFRSVSHAYQRPTYPEWPYPLFGMIHGRSVEECRQTAEAIREATGLPEYDLLFSTKEWKKVRVQYFTEPGMTPEQLAVGSHHPLRP